MTCTARQTASIFAAVLLLLGQRPATMAAGLGWNFRVTQEEAKPAKGEKDVKLRNDPRRAQKAAQRGDQAEAAGKTEEAMLHYQEAVYYAPGNTSYAAHEAALRSKLVRSHVETAERAALEGSMEKATDELSKALKIDPGNAVVRERLSEMQSMDDEPPTPTQVQAAGLAQLQPTPGKKDVTLRGQTRNVYEQLASMFGIKASFDPDVTEKQVRLRLQDVDFYTAMGLLGTQTGTFYRALNPRLAFIAPDTPDKRKQYAPQVQQVFMLPASVAPDEMTELLRVVRDIIGTTHIELDTRSRTITLRDTPEHVSLAGQLIEEVEKARGEVLLEIELLEVDRAAARKLGLTPPTSTSLILLTPRDVASLAASTDLANLLTNAQSIFTGKGFSSIPPFILVGGGLSTFLLTIPGTTADFSDSLSLVRSGRQVLLRAQDGKPATFFVGDRFPVTLSLLSTSLGGSTIAGVPGSTTFPETSFAVGANPSALVAGHFTGGTLPDLAVVFNNDVANTFTILQNQDLGNFVQVSTPPITLGANEKGQVAIGTGVFRTDSTKFITAQPEDLILVNSTTNNVSVLLGNTDANGVSNGTFTEAPGSPITVGANPSSIVVADFNADGILDFAVSNKNDNSISVFRGVGDGTFTQFPASPFLLNTAGATETGPIAMVSGTFRQGDMADLAVVNQTSNNVSILLDNIDTDGNITLTEAPNSPMAVGTSPVAIATGDLNTDGVGDLAVVNQGDNSLSILLGSTTVDGTFTVATNSPLPTATTPAGVVIASFANGPGPDIAVSNRDQSTLSVFLNQGSGTFQTGIELNTPVGPSALITSVLTTSGLPDVALVATGSTAGQGIVSIIQDSADFAASGSGTGQTPYPGSEYMDIGLKIKATPGLHPNNEVTLALEFEIRALAGGSVNGIPIISNRTLTQTIRVKDDQPTLIGGLADREETRAITGLPGFAEIPGVGYAFGARSKSLTDTELMILVTPHRLRYPRRDSKTIFAGHGERGATPSTLPSERVQPP